MITMTSQIASLTIVYSTIYSGSEKRMRQSSASLAFVRGIHHFIFLIAIANGHLLVGYLPTGLTDDW